MSLILLLPVYFFMYLSSLTYCNSKCLKILTTIFVSVSFIHLIFSIDNIVTHFRNLKKYLYAVKTFFYSSLSSTQFLLSSNIFLYIIQLICAHTNRWKCIYTDSAAEFFFHLIMYPGGHFTSAHNSFSIIFLKYLVFDWMEVPYNLIYYFPIDEHLDSFHAFVFINNVVINDLVYILFCMCINTGR